MAHRAIVVPHEHAKSKVARAQDACLPDTVRTLNEGDAQRVMLIRAIELADDAHTVLSRADRRSASEAAREHAQAAADAHENHDQEATAFLVHRARVAAANLERSHPEVAHARRSMTWPRWTTWVLPLIAFITGFAANELGGDRRINIISFPLLGMLAWNALVYAFYITGSAAAAFRNSGGGHAGPLANAIVLLAQRVRMPSAPAGPVARGLGRFAVDWSRAARRLNTIRARALLHLSAAMLAAGAVAGLYVRGLALEYLAGWESTFLGAHAVHRLLMIVLGPAAALSNLALPSPDGLAALRFSATQPGENAASWIHLYAITTALFVLLPRLALALWDGVLARRMHTRFVLGTAGDPYFERLLAQRHGRSEVVRVVSYSYHPDARTREELHEIFAELLGERVDLQFEATVAYGGEDDYLENATRGEGDVFDYLVVLFNIAATPEDENHGAFVAGLQRILQEPGRAGRLIVVLNTSPYRQRLASQADAARRLGERVAAWESMLAARGAKSIALELEAQRPRPSAKRLGTLIFGSTEPHGAS